MPSINVRLDDDAYDGLRLFGRTQGVTMSALVNALGAELAAIDDARMPTWTRRLVARGREVDAERRARPSP